MLFILPKKRIINKKIHGMKKSVLLSLLIGMMGVMAFVGCEKQSSCECGIQGHLKVLDEPYKADFGNHFKDIKITAYFYDLDGNMYYITGKTPRKISYSTIVTVKLKDYPDIPSQTEGPVTADYTGEVFFYSLECINE